MKKLNWWKRKVTEVIYFENYNGSRIPIVFDKYIEVTDD